MSLAERLMRRLMPLPEVLEPPRRRPAPVLDMHRELPATRHLPDPYGPDPVVFGSVPRVGPC